MADVAMITTITATAIASLVVAVGSLLVSVGVLVMRIGNAIEGITSN